MDAHRYDFEAVRLDELLDARDANALDPERVFACDRSGTCAVETLVDDVRQALVDRLNERGAAGWRLVQMEFHARVVLLVWEMPGEA